MNKFNYGEFISRFRKMKSFLSKYCKKFEEHILNLIGEYAGSVLTDNMYLRISSKLKFTVRQDGNLGKIFMVVHKVSKISSNAILYKKILKPRFWVVCRNGWWHFNVVKKIMALEGQFIGARILRECLQHCITENYILCCDELRGTSQYLF